MLWHLFYAFKNSIPPNLGQERTVFIPAQPCEQGFADDVILRYETPISGIKWIVAIVSHHPVVVHLERITIRLLAVNVQLPIALLHRISFVGSDGTDVDG